MTIEHVIAIILVLVVGNYVNKHWRKWWYRKDINFPATGIRRPELEIGFYSCDDEQVAETRGAINLLMESQFGGPDKCIQNILDAGVHCMLDISFQIFYKRTKEEKNILREDARTRLHDFFTLLQSRGALKYIKYIYPIDEPNNTLLDPEGSLQLAIPMIEDVASHFPELADHMLAVIYAADKPFPCQHMFHRIGFDDYDMKSHVLVSKKYKDLKASLLPHQKIMIIPGGAYGQDPTPFVNFAQANLEVAIILSFLWFNDTNGNVGALGIRSNGMSQKYITAGKSVLPQQ